MHNITYTIEKQDAERQDLLVIRLSEQNLNLTQWRKMAISPLDKEALTLLLKEEMAYQQRLNGRTPHAESLSFCKIHVGPAQTIPILQHLALTHQLYFNGKQLVADFYGRVEFYYDAVIREYQALEVNGRLKWRDIDIPLSECSYIGPGKPNWFIRGISLKLITTSVSWKRLHQMYHARPLILQGPQKKAFLEEIDPDDSDTPQMIIKGGSIEDLQQSDAPMPLLILKDRSGAFADLWMDYGHKQKVLFQDPRATLKESHANVMIKRQMEAEKKLGKRFARDRLYS